MALGLQMHIAYRHIKVHVGASVVYCIKKHIETDLLPGFQVSVCS